MRTLFAFLNTKQFWIYFALLIFLLTGVFYYTDNRREAQRNAEQLAAQRQTLAYLCDVVHVIDNVYVQSARVDEELIQDASLSKSIKRLIRSRLRDIQIAHQELSETQACLQVE